LRKGDEIAIDVEDPELATAPRSLAQRRIWMDDPLRVELREQGIDAGDIDATTRVLGDLWVGAWPEMYLDCIASHNAPGAGVDMHGREAEARAIERN